MINWTSSPCENREAFLNNCKCTKITKKKKRSNSQNDVSTTYYINLDLNYILVRMFLTLDQSNEFYVLIFNLLTLVKLPRYLLNKLIV